MVKRFFIFVAVLSVLGAGYFTYDKWIDDADLSVWSFVPSNSLFVYENDKLAETYRHLSEQNFFKSLSLIESIDLLNKKITELDSVLEMENGFIEAFENAPHSIAINSTSKTELGALFIVELSSIGKQSTITKLHKRFSADGWNQKNREYLGYKITELVGAQRKTFTYLIYRNYFIGSYSAFLVEDAIRTLADNNFQNFKDEHTELFGIAKLKKDQGNVYVNLARLEDILSVFTVKKETLSFAYSSFLDVELAENTLEMTGFSYPEKNDFLSYFLPVTGSSFDIAEVISNETSLLYHMSFTDADVWRKATLNVIGPLDKNRKASFISEADFDVEYLYSVLEEEVASGKYGDENIPFMVLETTNSNEASRFLRESSERFMLSKDDTLFLESYKDYDIIEIPFRQFPSALIGDLAGDFPDCFFFNYRNYLVFTQSLPTAKDIIDDIENENTWSKSIRKNRFLEKTNQEAVFSLFVDVPNTWKFIIEQLNPQWKKFASDNQYVLKNFQNVAIQFNPIDNKFYANLLVEQPGGSNLETSNIRDLNTLALGSPVATKPYIVKNHDTQLYETILQDTSNNLILVGTDFTPLWSRDLGEKIVSDIEQIDYFKNNKLQYVFITENQLHIIDRTGEDVAGFPITIKSIGALAHLSIIDYDGSKNYRFGITDEAGNTVLTNKEGNPLDGWNPMSFNTSLTAPMRHYRIGGTDVFVALMENGEIQLLSRRGKNYPGFPVKLNEPVSSDYHLKAGSNFTSTALTTVTSSGALVSFNLKGATISRQQLLKPAAETNYSILNDVTRKYFLVKQTTQDQMAILDPEATRLFQKDYLNDQSPFIQYYRISSSQQFIVVGERKGEFLYIYDLNGRLITRRPIAGNNPISMIYYERKGELQLYIASGNELNLTAISE